MCGSRNLGSQLWWDLPLEQSFELVRHLYRVPAGDHRRRLGELIEVLQLGPLLASPVRSLSLGQRMRSELAAAVLPAPRVLFLDEPTIGLDVEAKAAVRGFLRELNRAEGTTVILTTHDLDDIAELCHRLLTSPWRSPTSRTSSAASIVARPGWVGPGPVAAWWAGSRGSSRR